MAGLGSPLVAVAGQSVHNIVVHVGDPVDDGAQDTGGARLDVYVEDAVDAIVLPAIYDKVHRVVLPDDANVRLIPGKRIVQQSSSDCLDDQATGLRLAHPASVAGLQYAHGGHAARSDGGIRQDIGGAIESGAVEMSAILVHAGNDEVGSEGAPVAEEDLLDELIGAADTHQPATGVHAMDVHLGVGQVDQGTNVARHSGTPGAASATGFMKIFKGI